MPRASSAVRPAVLCLESGNKAKNSFTGSGSEAVQPEAVSVRATINLMQRLMIVGFVLIAAAFAADRDLAGRFGGEWKSASSESGGTIQFALAPQEGAAWKCDLTFSLNDAEVKTSMREVKLQEGKIELVYDFDVQGTTLRSRVKGEWDGAAFRGKYETTVSDGSQQVDSGSWSASRKK